MEAKVKQPTEAANIDCAESLDRRDLVEQLGKFAAYAVPFTMLATTASAASGAGSGKKASSKQ
jgi:hypothetical protein